MTLSYKLLFVVVFSAVVSVLLFYVLFVNRYEAVGFYIKHSGNFQTTSEQIEGLQDKITVQHISKKDKKTIRDLMKEYKSLTMTLYSENDEYIADHILSEDSLSISTNSFWLEIYYPEVEDYTLNFYDGTCYLIVQSYQGMGFMWTYLFTITTLSLVLFFGLIMHFVRKKMKYVMLLENEMKLIENGDLTHLIEYQGNDELTSLALQLNHLRMALKDNMEKESEARKSNEELITTMSHDLRTPLTSLLGYLDILQMKLYKDDADRESYVEKSKSKAEQIKYMSDRLFTHFFVIAQDEDVLLQRLSLQVLRDLLYTCVQELESSEFEVSYDLEEEEGYFFGDVELLGRVFDNAFSNIVKYAQKQGIQIQVHVDHQVVEILLRNQKRLLGFKEESTCIGLKSIEKMMKKMNGSVTIQEEESCFLLVLQIPLAQSKDF